MAQVRPTVTSIISFAETQQQMGSNSGDRGTRKRTAAEDSSLLLHRGPLVPLALRIIGDWELPGTRGG